MKNKNVGSYRIVLFSLFVFFNAQTNKASAQALAFNDNPTAKNISQSTPAVSAPAQPNKPSAASAAEPLFPGGEDSLQRYLFTHIMAPDSLYSRDVSGAVYFSFFVEANGKIDRIKIEKGPASPGWDSATISCIRSMPNWIPGSVNNTPKAMRCFLPVMVPPGHELYNMPDSVNIR
jgi:hypothetical protein